MRLKRNFALSGAVLLAGLLYAGVSPQNADPLLKEIDGYRKWQRVTKSPVYMKLELMVMCSMPGPEYGPKNPHVPRYIRVFVNEKGKDAMTKGGKFPPGSVIVKEKHPAPEEARPVTDEELAKQSPELLTVMIKREKGFDEANGDWQYFVYSPGHKKLESKDVKHCQSCHQGRKQNDYVFADYVNRSR